MAFAQGRIGIFLEGGYFVESVAEGVAMCVRALLGQVNLRLGPLPSPDPSLVESVLNVISMQRTVWNCETFWHMSVIQTYPSWGGEHLWILEEHLCLTNETENNGNSRKKSNIPIVYLLPATTPKGTKRTSSTPPPTPTRTKLRHQIL